MKTVLKAALTLSLCAVLLMALAAPALAAEASVSYESSADKFVFLPGDDLFLSFKGVMPGDTLTQQIAVKNAPANGVKVKIYLRAEPVDKAYEAFLGQMKLKVVQNGSSVLFDAVADEQGGLSSDVCLGTFYSGADISLTVSLSVPLAMGNEFQNSEGRIRWVFSAEELPIEPDDPDTGDTANIGIFAGVFALSAAGLLTLLLLRRAKSKSIKPRQDIKL